MERRYAVGAVILAAGSGTRMCSDKTKQKMLVGNTSILKRSVMAFEKCEVIDKIAVVVKKDEVEFAASELNECTKLCAIVEGGEYRAQSARNGFVALGECDFVAIHDSARVLITPEMISAVASEAYINGAATAAAPVVDTFKIVDENGFIQSSPDRSRLVKATTPQIFKRELYEKAVEQNTLPWEKITDDNILLEGIGVQVCTVILKQDNIKITTADDIKYAEMILQERGELYV